MAIETKIAVDLGTEMEEIEAVPGRVPNPGTVPKNRYKHRRQSRDNNRNRDRSESRSRFSSQVSTKLRQRADVTGAMSTIILPENVLMIPQVEISMTQKAHF